MDDNEIEQLVEPLLKFREEYGIGVGLERAAAELETLSHDAFQKEDDRRAFLLRELHKFLKTMAENQFDLWRNHNKEKDIAWENLENALL